MVLLGDHVRIASAGRPPCAAQVAEAFARRQAAAMIGVHTVGPEALPRMGVARGKPAGNGVYLCTDFVEKPDPATARRRLRTEDLPEDRFLAHCGIYIFTTDILDCLAELAAPGRPAEAELELADAQAMLLERRPESYYLCRVAGRAYDAGTPTGYREAQVALVGEGPQPAT